MAKAARVAKMIFRALLGVALVAAGVMHFVAPEPYIAMMPDGLPAHAELVFISGVAEVLLGLALFVPHQSLRALAGWGVVALLIAVWPANIWMATQGVRPPGLEMSTTAAWIRVAFQPLLMLWAWAVTRPDGPTGEDSARSSSGLKASCGGSVHR